MLNQLHEIQREIIVKLIFTPGLRHKDLRPNTETENNQLNFHIKQLLVLGLIEKKGELYSLTLKGKQYGNRVETSNKSVITQAKISVWLSPVREKHGKKEYLIYTRLKTPFYGAQGFLAGKLAYGETLIDAAKRELKEETGLEGEPELIQIRHYINRNKLTNDILEDKFLYLFKVNEPKGELVECNEGKYEWMDESQFSEKVTAPFDGFDNFLSDVDLISNFDGHLKLVEMLRYPENF